MPFDGSDEEVNGSDEKVSGSDEEISDVCGNGDVVRFCGEEVNGGDEDVNGWDEEVNGWDEEINGWDEEIKGWDEEVNGWDEKVNCWDEEVTGWDAEVCGSDEIFPIAEPRVALDCIFAVTVSVCRNVELNASVWLAKLVISFVKIVNEGTMVTSELSGWYEVMLSLWTELSDAEDGCIVVMCTVTTFDDDPTHSEKPEDDTVTEDVSGAFSDTRLSVENTKVPLDDTSADVSKSVPFVLVMTFSFGGKAIVVRPPAIDVCVEWAEGEGSFSGVTAVTVDLEDVEYDDDARLDIVWVSSGMAETVSSP